MPPAWWDETARFVDALEGTQQELFAALREQRRALVLGDATELDRLNGVAGEAARRLQQLSGWRTRLIDHASVDGGSASNLSDVLSRTMGMESESLRARLQRVQHRFLELRREAWIQWVISHRGQSVYADLLDLIAHGGQKAPTYHDGQPPAGQGGVMLDAAA
jgi:hypothetical protein